MEKIMPMEKALSQITENSTVFLGNIGSDKTAENILLNLEKETTASNLDFITLDGYVNNNNSFSKILGSRVKSLISAALLEESAGDNLAFESVDATLLIDRIRAGGAGVPAFYVEDYKESGNREKKEIDGKPCVLETAIKGDVAIIRAKIADKEGNCRVNIEDKRELYLALSSTYTIIVADEICEIGEIDPEYVNIPGLLVKAITESASLKEQ